MDRLKIDSCYQWEQFDIDFQDFLFEMSMSSTSLVQNLNSGSASTQSQLHRPNQSTIHGHVLSSYPGRHRYQGPIIDPEYFCSTTSA